MSSYKEGQVHQLVERLEAEGFTLHHITLLGQTDKLSDIKLLLEGEAEIVKKKKGPQGFLSPFFRLIGRDLVIPACPGGNLVLPSFRYVDPNFKVRCVHNTPTPEVSVAVYEVFRDCGLADINRLDLKRLCLSSQQIMEFVRIYGHYIGRAVHTSFFVCSEGKLFVLFLYRSMEDYLFLYVEPAHDYAWLGRSGQRLVVPSD